MTEKGWIDCKWLLNWYLPKGYAVCSKVNGFMTLRNGKQIDGYPCCKEKCEMIE